MSLHDIARIAIRMKILFNETRKQVLSIFLLRIPLFTSFFFHSLCCTKMRVCISCDFYTFQVLSYLFRRIKELLLNALHTYILCAVSDNYSRSLLTLFSHSLFSLVSICAWLYMVMEKIYVMKQEQHQLKFIAVMKVYDNTV